MKQNRALFCTQLICSKSISLLLLRISINRGARIPISLSDTGILQKFTIRERQHENPKNGPKDGRRLPARFFRHCDEQKNHSHGVRAGCAIEEPRNITPYFSYTLSLTEGPLHLSHIEMADKRAENVAAQLLITCASSTGVGCSSTGDRAYIPTRRPSRIAERIYYASTATTGERVGRS